MKILITGGTGFIGQRLAYKLASEGHEIMVLTRKESFSKAKNLFKATDGITLIEGDITHSDVISNISVISNVVNQIECIIHLAALYSLEASVIESYLMNVVGTQNLIGLMRKMENLKFFHYFSTYAVNPVTSGIVAEDFLLTDVPNSLDEYTKSKNTAEHLVRKAALKNVQTIIHRPGIIIGDSQTGKMDKTDGPYYFFSFIQKLKKFNHIIEKIKYLPLPLSPKSISPLLPIDTLVEWCVEIVQNPKQGNLKTYHLVPKNRIFTKDFLESAMLLLNCPLKIVYVNAPVIFAPLFKSIGMPRELLFFMSQQAVFDRTNLEKDYPHLKERNYHEYLEVIINEYSGSKK